MSETARMLDDAAERMLARHFATAARGTGASADALIAAFKDAGLDQLLVPESAGGMGGGVLEAAAVACRWGYHAAPGPIVEMLLLPALAAAAGLASAEGVALALTEDALPRGPGASDAPRALTLCAPVIGQAATSLLVGAPDEQGRLLLARFDADRAEACLSLAGEPVLLLDVGAERPKQLFQTPLAFSDAAARGALLTASAILGANQRLLEITIEHANTRKQFGKPLGKFQAIQHRLAEAASEHVVAQAATRSAIAAENEGGLPGLPWRSAKIQAGRAATAVAAAAHQILGAIGFTEEHVLHHYTKRLWMWRDAWGAEAALERRLGAEACANAGRLWPWMVD